MSIASGIAARPSISIRELALLALFCLLWSSAFAAAKIAIGDAPPLLLLAPRFLLAGGICLAVARAMGERRGLRWRQIGALTLLGLLNNAVYLGLTWTGMQTGVGVSSGFTAVLISANPLLIALIALPVLGETLTPRKILGLLLGLAGVVIVLRSRLGTGVEDLHGTLLVLAGLASLVAGTILYKRIAPPVGPWTGNGVQLLMAGLFLLPVALWLEDLERINPTLSLALSWGWMIVGVSVGGYFLWYRILARRSATEASSLHFLMPPLGLALGWLLIGEPVPPLDLIGIVPIAVGIALVTRGGRAPPLP